MVCMCEDSDFDKITDDIREKMMSSDDILMVSLFFKALSDPTRISIVNALLVHGWLCVTDLTKILNMTKSAISHQLSILRLNKLVKVRRDGQRVYYALCDKHVQMVLEMTISHIKEDESNEE